MSSKGPGYKAIKNFLPLEAHASSGRSNWFRVSEGTQMILYVETTVISGTNDIEIEGTWKQKQEGQEDGATNAWVIDTIAQISGAGKVIKRLTSPFGMYLRIKYALSATSTFSVIGVLE